MAERIQKKLAQIGVGSRREIERWIQEGRIKVNGEYAKIGQAVSDDDVVIVSGRKIYLDGDKTPSRHLIVYNKPEGEVCTRSDPQGRPTVFNKLPTVRNGRWISIGRLDVNTSGLLLFTSDGELANRLMHPSYQIDREYAVRVMGDVTDEMINTLVNGVELEDGMARFEEVVIQESEKERESVNQWYYVCIQEGRNREVRRLWESLEGIKVSRLKRVRYANVFLDKNIRQGQWKELPQEELDALYELVELKAPKVVVEEKPDGSRKEKSTRNNRSGSKKPHKSSPKYDALSTRRKKR